MAEKTVPTNGGNLPVTKTAQTPATREDTRHLIPPVDIFETDKGLTVVADLPGVSRDGISVRVDDGVLTIEGKVKPVVHGEPLFNGFTLYDYFRQFELSDRVDVGKIDAKYEQGVLTVHLPRAEAHKPRQIPVSVK